MSISFADSLTVEACVGISGHAGCGHANSHLGFVQDDSGGLAAVLTILQRASGIDLTIVQVETQTGINGSFTVKTASGGIGKATARRGITKPEARLAQYVVGRQAVCTQALAFSAFGRIAGQGAMEVPVALQTAIANAAVNSFGAAMPEKVLIADEEIPGNCGRILGTKLMIDGIPVALMAVTNATEGGIGPNEDIEGNVNLAGKKALMASLGLDSLPTFLIEGKVCAEPVSSEITEPTFLIRAYPGDDNTAAAAAYLESAQKLGYPAVYRRELLGRSPTALRSLTRKLGEDIIALGTQFRDAVTAREKVRLAAELNEFCSQELGGVTFMSDDVHRVMGGVGMIPGTCACLSLFIPNAQLEKEVIPALSEADAGRFADVIQGAVTALLPNLDEARAEVRAGKTRAAELASA